MPQKGNGKLVNDFLGSAEIFTSAVADLMQAQLREVGGTTVTYSQLKLLKMVARAEGSTVTNVATFLGVSTAAASRAVDRLVRRGLLRRKEAAVDRRAVELSVTPAAEQLLAQYDVAATAALQAVFGDLDPADLERTAQLLDSLSVHIIEGTEPTGEYCFRCGIHFRDRCLLRQVRHRECYFHQRQRRDLDASPSEADGPGRTNPSRRE